MADVLNKEITNAIEDLDLDKNMKGFLVDALNYELEQVNTDKKDGPKVAGKVYKELIANYAK